MAISKKYFQGSAIQRWGSLNPSDRPSEVIVDPEFGAFGDNGCIDFVRTKYDNQLDKNSLLPKSE